MRPWVRNVLRSCGKECGSADRPTPYLFALGSLPAEDEGCADDNDRLEETWWIC
jgi:hypothetical protein